MIEVVQQFAACCRAAGLKVSTAEVLDCFRHIELIELVDEDQFRTALRTNFVKTRREQGKFDRLYHLFFHELRTEIDIAHSSPLSEIVQNIMDQFPKNQMDSSQQAILEFVSGNPVQFLKKVQEIQTEGDPPVQAIRSNLGSLTRRLNLMLRMNAVQEMLFSFLTENQSQIAWETQQSLQTYVSRRLDNARKYLGEDAQMYQGGIDRVTSYEKHLNQLGDKPFSSLTPKEIEEMREVIAQLVRKLKDAVSLRYAKQDKGIIDVKQTLRQSVKYQGIPIKIIFRKRPPRKGKIVTLCDVSGSVWSAARFMLNMLYSLQECFTKVRSFVFVAELDEVTSIFETNEINQAIDKALKEAQISYHADTDYGAALRQFKRCYMDALNKKTTLIIIGDGRSNYGNPEEDILDEMREKCRRVVWLNPEPKAFWYSGDSEMRTYEGYCHQVRVCNNLNQLIDFINELVL
ncbi:MAG: VWA domain-containing protein [Desulfobacterales bacterium]|nr:VWA domain-containing protein [Desulfobacterales bacterium]